MSETLEALWAVVRSIPPGRVAGYGAVGRALPHRASGLLVGRWMASAPPGVPWWRVLASSGELVIAKRNPVWAKEQRERLEAEGVPFDGELVSKKAFIEPEPLR